MRIASSSERSSLLSRRLAERSGSSDGAPPLPPGQHLIDHFPRYGTHLFLPIPDLSRLDSIGVAGAVTRPLRIPIADLAAMPRSEVMADFHCVAGWSVRGLLWGGVSFRTLYDAMIAPHAKPGVTHLRFTGIDGFRSVLPLEDALDDDVMLADHLDSQVLGGNHGGPVRVVAPSRYGYKSTKHLTRIELHTSEPDDDHLNRLVRTALRLVKPHPRARVGAEERHRHLPARSVRGTYWHVLHPVFRSLCQLGERTAGAHRGSER